VSYISDILPSARPPSPGLAARCTVGLSCHEAWRDGRSTGGDHAIGSHGGEAARGMAARGSTGLAGAATGGGASIGATTGGATTGGGAAVIAGSGRRAAARGRRPNGANSRATSASAEGALLARL